MPLAPMALRRITAELQEWQRAPPDGWQFVHLGGGGQDDLSVWHLLYTGDAGTLYEGEEYGLSVRGGPVREPRSASGARQHGTAMRCETARAHAARGRSTSWTPTR